MEELWSAKMVPRRPLAPPDAFDMHCRPIDCGTAHKRKRQSAGVDAEDETTRKSPDFAWEDISIYSRGENGAPSVDIYMYRLVNV